MSTQDHLPLLTLEDRKADAEIAVRSRELDLKEREVTAKETEVKRSQWLNPTVIGLFAATVGLVSSVIVARVNNQNTQDVERLRAQSSLVLEAIRTGTGKTDDACKNLRFFVELELLDDPHGAIQKKCASAPSGPPSLPAQGSTSRPIAGSEALNSIEALYLIITENYSNILAACETDEQRQHVRSSYAQARRNYWNSVNRVPHDDDPAIKQAVAQLNKFSHSLQESISSHTSITSVIAAMDSAVVASTGLASMFE